MKRVLGKILSAILGSIVLISSFMSVPAQAAPAGNSVLPRWIPPKPVHTQIMGWESKSAIEIKFAEGTSYRARSGKLTTLGHDNLPALQAVLDKYPLQAVERVFTQPEAQISAEKRALEAAAHEQMPDLNLWYRLTVKEGTNTEALIDALNALPEVEIAYPAPLPAPLPTPNFAAQQVYLNAAPAGLDATYAWTRAGGTGSNVTIVDVEYSFNQSHEDLPAIPVIGGQEYPAFGDDHGTAVLGELAATNNGWGVTGLAYGAAVKFSSACLDSVSCSYDPANAISVAQANTAPGDVILVEQQYPVCGLADYGPVEWLASVYDAIKVATTAGRNVVEAAGNGNVNLDGAGCGGLFNRATRDSGAIIVGAGAPPNYTQADRSRMYFSSYGSRVDVQGWGWNVVTTGYGDLYSGTGQNQWYTDTFAGTSSASPMVAGSVALLSSITREKGVVKPPSWIRSTLVKTGSAQQAASGFPVSQHIGPRPNLKAAIAALAPVAFLKSSPSNAAVNQPTNLALTWGASAGATSYQYCYSITIPCTNWINNGTATSIALMGLAQNSTYHWQVRAANSFGTTYANGGASATWSFTTRHLISLTLRSTGTEDGWILESSETSSLGGTMSASANALILGDDGSNRQYRSVLSFATAGLPDTAVIQSAVLKIKQTGTPSAVSPFDVLGNLVVDIKKPYFGTGSTLQLGDFNAVASAANVGTFNRTPSSGWYSVMLSATGRNNISKVGTTQFRLRFSLDDNNDNSENLLRFFSGDYVPTTSYRPTLVLTYYVP